MLKDTKDNQEQDIGLNLLKKGKKGFFRIVFSRLGIMVVLLILQILVIFSVAHWCVILIPHLVVVILVFLVGIIIYLLNSSIDPTAKITWLVLIILMPISGTLLLLYTQNNVGFRTLKKRSEDTIAQTKEYAQQDKEVLDSLNKCDKGAASLAKYISQYGGYPTYDKTAVTYFPLGENKWEEMLIQLESAEQFIFMEYFIVAEGEMWGKVLEILARKAQQGVEVRFMYDGTCEFSTLPHDYPKRLEKLGIQCKMFAPVTPFVSTHYNYRDHRKVLVIDGKTAFTGGVNLADEYINKTQKYGHWKDTAIMLKGNAVKNFTLMFLQMWNITEKDCDYEKYLNVPILPEENAKGFAAPYGDSPLDSNKTGERVYMDILNRSCEYVHIMSPYLILDGEIETALKFAAERGVDVQIILPGIPDKKAPYALAKTHYTSLIDSGVKIYEYTPGFVHAKVFVSDSREAVVGTINLDYRSLYHHFECAAYLYGTQCIPEIEEDFQETLKKCKEVTYETVRQEKWTVKLTGWLMKVIAPLL